MRWILSALKCRFLFFRKTVTLPFSLGSIYDMGDGKPGEPQGNDNIGIWGLLILYSSTDFDELIDK